MFSFPANSRISFREQKSIVIDSTLNPIWNQYFYFNISSFQTNELLIKIFDKDEFSKDDLLYKLIIPIKNLKYGIVEDKWYSSLHLITHILIPGNYSFCKSNGYRIRICN